MAIVGQSGHTAFLAKLNGSATHTLTIALNYPKMISAHAQICDIADNDGVMQCGIRQVVTVGSGVENFSSPLPMIFRQNVLTLTFEGWVWHMRMGFYLIINFWS